MHLHAYNLFLYIRYLWSHGSLAHAIDFTLRATNRSGNASDLQVLLEHFLGVFVPY